MSAKGIPEMECPGLGMDDFCCMASTNFSIPWVLSTPAEPTTLMSKRSFSSSLPKSRKRKFNSFTSPCASISSCVFRTKTINSHLKPCAPAYLYYRYLAHPSLQAVYPLTLLTSCCVSIVSLPLSQLLFVKVVVLVVLRALQGQLEGEAILGDLVDPYSRGNLSRSRVGSALLARFGGSVRLP